ncbi:MAG: hypothetical protein ABEI80_06170 [Haloplanus sp.]
MADREPDVAGETGRLELAAWTAVLLVPFVGLLWEFGTALLEPGSPLRTALATVRAHRLENTVPIGVVSSLQRTIFGFAIVLGGAVVLTFIYATVRYSETLRDRPTQMARNWIRGSFLGWFSLVLAVFVITGFMAGAILLSTESNPTPTRTYDTEGEVTYMVVGVQWTWMMNAGHLAHPMRRRMYVPANTTVHLRIKSKDVIHSFAIQAFGVKKDAVPGQTNSAYFIARDPGRYQINCAELCGAGHSQMTPQLVVLPRQQYAEWVVEHGGTNPFQEITVDRNQMNEADATDPWLEGNSASHESHDHTHASTEVTTDVRT